MRSRPRLLIATSAALAGEARGQELSPVPTEAPAGGAPEASGAARGGADDAAAAPDLPPAARTGEANAVSANPAAVNTLSGTGALGRRLGLTEDSGVRLGGLWIGDASGVLSGGRSPGRWGLNSLAVASLSLDAEKRYGWSGASFGTEFLQFNGQPTNSLAGAFPGFDSLPGTAPLDRSEL